VQEVPRRTGGVRLGIDEPDLRRGQRQSGAVPELPLLLCTVRTRTITIPFGLCHRAGIQIPMYVWADTLSTTFMFHLVFVTKYRRRAMTGEMLTRCEEIMREVCEDFEAELKQFNGEEDHVHLLVHHPPKVQLSKLVNSLKGVSSRYLRKEYDAHVRRYLWGGHFWSGSYFAGSCGGAPLTAVRQYIDNQQRPV
jgi:putative transposase